MATPEQRSKAARLAAHASWAKTPNRAERTAAARAASPTQIDYHIAKLRSEREYASEQDLLRAAQNSLTEEMTRRGRAGAATKRAAKAVKQVNLRRSA